MKRLPKTEYFKRRYLQAKESGNTQKAEYYKSRLKQLEQSLLKEPYVVNDMRYTFSTDKYCEAVRKTVNVLNAPMGTVNQKQSYITEKLMSEGWTKEEASTISLESLYT